MKKLLLLVLLLNVISCTLLQRQKVEKDKAKKEILRNLYLSKNISATGIASISFKNFEYNCGFSLRKQDSNIRLDFFSGGMLGLAPKPKLNIVITDSLYIYFPFQKKLYVEKFAGFKINKLLKKIEDEPLNIENNSYQITISENIELTFNSKFLLKKLKFKKFFIILKNYKRSYPFLINIYQSNSQLASFEFYDWQDFNTNKNIFKIDTSKDVEIIKGIDKIIENK